MTKYAGDHAGALADLAADGVAVTFTFASGTHNPATGSFSTPTTTTVTGNAMQMAPDRKQYEALNLVQGRATTLFFAPTTINVLPALGSTFSFGGETFSVRAVEPLAPDGPAIAATIVGAR